jgi:short-subunit dehydrogenase
VIGFRSISAIPPEAPSGEHGGGRVQACLSGLACLPGLVDTEYHKVAGRDPAKMPPMMKAADVVAASLAALKRGEVVCIPGLDDPALIGNFAELRRTILMKANRPALAQRYL